MTAHTPPKSRPRPPTTSRCGGSKTASKPARSRPRTTALSKLIGAIGGLGGTNDRGDPLGMRPGAPDEYRRRGPAVSAAKPVNPLLSSWLVVFLLIVGPVVAAFVALLLA
jgi:hypothetical protein